MQISDESREEYETRMERFRKRLREELKEADRLDPPPNGMDLPLNVLPRPGELAMGVYFDPDRKTNPPLPPQHRW